MHITVVCLVFTWSLSHSHAATTILHGNGQVASAISHQSFTRLSSAEPLALRSRKQPHPLLVPSARIVNHHQAGERQQVERFFQAAAAEEEVQRAPISGQTPAHLTYAAHPVVHQMLPRIKPVRNISYASLTPGPRNLNTHTNRNLSPV
ncbi:uncharacterized protein LOC6544972 [Drosophila erecta]|uniref:Uncharacterized protein n=1 Tax=Drosophila erecta TaxID=7220 RepID=B3NIA9_DROER|nr:uncharacterized protein LOC6544972 [Drosophila erecta]EDV52265.1 uncharacterized protein Dere_GG15988 [Drosophila erecta]